MIETSTMVASTDSENTAYRHFAKMLDYLFKGTQLKVLDGEPGSLAVKEDMISNQPLYPNTAESTHTLSTSSIKKIDAIVYMKIRKTKVELSNDEWKKPLTSTATALKQQSKNLRSNLSILNSLQQKYRIKTESILAMAVIGYTGYI
ncbi:uncharacterized protein EV154DRAFT_287404 [Mucor mucedo]|uniref:uncharacterized protein n=1 Tax=Mucor mucedo TaxID=29922 RepID=UPI00221FF320|nr:uncharacterized protein EV154DRAFT_287404 [Mucor mucedo]KAI7889193.1 hypothetical protein EV154DRAFT_287404 [Mucor mucedo]